MYLLDLKATTFAINQKENIKLIRQEKLSTLKLIWRILECIASNLITLAEPVLILFPCHSELLMSKMLEN